MEKTELDTKAILHQHQALAYFSKTPKQPEICLYLLLLAGCLLGSVAERAFGSTQVAWGMLTVCHHLRAGGCPVREKCRSGVKKGGMCGYHHSATQLSLSWILLQHLQVGAIRSQEGKASGDQSRVLLVLLWGGSTSQGHRKVGKIITRPLYLVTDTPWVCLDLYTLTKAADSFASHKLSRVGQKKSRGQGYCFPPGWYYMEKKCSTQKSWCWHYEGMTQHKNPGSCLFRYLPITKDFRISSSKPSQLCSHSDNVHCEWQQKIFPALAL